MDSYMESYRRIVIMNNYTDSYMNTYKNSSINNYVDSCG
jgi:hypothetical protein